MALILPDVAKRISQLWEEAVAAEPGLSHVCGCVGTYVLCCDRTFSPSCSCRGAEGARDAAQPGALPVAHVL